MNTALIIVATIVGVTGLLAAFVPFNRKNIDRSILIFIVALVATFSMVVVEILGQMGIIG